MTERSRPSDAQETWEDSPEGYPQTPPYEWWRRQDEYGQVAAPEDHEQGRRSK